MFRSHSVLTDKETEVSKRMDFSTVSTLEKTLPEV